MMMQRGPGGLAGVVFSLSGIRRPLWHEKEQGDGGFDVSCMHPVTVNHRCFSSALYMAKPSTANTVAPRLARSQNVEFFESTCARCLEEEKQGSLDGNVEGMSRIACVCGCFCVGVFVWVCGWLILVHQHLYPLTK